MIKPVGNRADVRAVKSLTYLKVPYMYLMYLMQGPHSTNFAVLMQVNLHRPNSVLEGVLIAILIIRKPRDRMAAIIIPQ